MKLLLWFWVGAVVLSLCNFSVRSEFSETSLGELEKIPHLRKLINRMRKSHKKKEDNKRGHGHKTDADSSTASTEIPESVLHSPKREKGKNRKFSVSDAKLALENKRRVHKRPKETTPPPPPDSTAGSEVSKANKHEQLIRRTAKCKSPAARLIRVRDVHHIEGHVTLMPHCTWLHRCQDDAACCPSESQTCAAATKEDIHLYFYKIPMSGKGSSIVRLPFENHTSCECRDRITESMPRTEPHVSGGKLHRRPGGGDFTHPAPTAWANSFSPPEAKHKPGNTALSADSADDDEEQLHFPTRSDEGFAAAAANASSEIKCQCVGDYNLVRVEEKENACLCDCHPHRKNCLRLKRGKNSFFLRDRKCIDQGRCSVPLCEYGTYIAALGRCPRRHEGNAHWISLLNANANQ